MKPTLVMPYHDPKGTEFPHLEAILPLLNTLFQNAILGVTPITLMSQPAAIRTLEANPFFDVFHQEPDLSVGEQFHALYAHAATACHPAQMLHLCFCDRLIFALQSGHRETFLHDIQSVTVRDAPLVFARSEKAWQTHPQNYRDIEGMATRAGEWLFGKTLDFAWCHLVIQTGTLGEILPDVNDPDISMLCEIMLRIRETVTLKAVDWLVWEDPFFAGCDPAVLKAQREGSLLETQKRLAYILPTLQLLVRASGDLNEKRWI
ncbi:MAG: hypothetical protein JXA21_02880 [Anaerolineae bacterium]|nr:hypothetical protein [Anaerolineae bacterium]